MCREGRCLEFVVPTRNKKEGRLYVRLKGAAGREREMGAREPKSFEGTAERVNASQRGSPSMIPSSAGQNSLLDISGAGNCPILSAFTNVGLVICLI